MPMLYESEDWLTKQTKSVVNNAEAAEGQRHRAVTAGRAWRLVRDHYAIRLRLSDTSGLMMELFFRRRSGASIRKCFADLARELRAQIRGEQE